MNPFRPTFGTSPPLLVGRDRELAAFVEALDEGPGAPGRATVYTGARGVGKTAMLNAAEDQARSRGWIIVSETARVGFVERLTSDGLPHATRQLNGQAQQRRVSGVSLPVIGGSVNFDVQPHQPSDSLRRQISNLTAQCQAAGTGLLVTIDEIQAADIAELRELATTIQHCVREDQEIAFVGAGLPVALESILNDTALTFLRRADRYELGPVDIDDVASALARPINDAGRSITAEALDTAARATAGYPFMIQLVGYHTYKARGDHSTITIDDVNVGVEAARRRLGQLVIEPELAGLSDIDRTFLIAMAQDDGPSKMADIQARLGSNVSANYASQYRLRLIKAEVIVAGRYGTVDFALPATRDYVRTHGVLDAQTTLGTIHPTAD